MLFLGQLTKYVKAMNMNMFGTSFRSWIMSWYGVWIVSLEIEIQVSKLRELLHPQSVQFCHPAAPSRTLCASGGVNI